MRFSSMKVNFFLLCLVLLFPACGRKNETNPLNSFQKIAQSCEKNFADLETDKTVNNSKTGKWINIRSSQYGYSYDVKKIDSLASPFSAVIEIKYERSIFIRNSEIEAKGASVFIAGDYIEKNTVLLNYIFAESSWKFAGAKRSKHLSHSATTEPAPSVISSEQLMAILPRAAACSDVKSMG